IERFSTEAGIPVSVAGREVSITIDEQRVAGFLARLAEAGISYSQITIDKPTLEDYFLQMSREDAAEDV
ncbi:hypothetical protein KBC79_04820, partial [Candidatus Woesebacteria bacterium]|nr:hypothetical protein [Candidatus Woesebacteria bacterium]